MRRHLFTFVTLLGLNSAPSLGQIVLPGGFSATDLIPSGISSATSMCVASDGTIYIALKTGALRVWREGSGLLPTQFFVNEPLNIQTSGERGLIGIALDPNFETNRFLYVHYTVNATPRHGRISRFTADSNGNLAVPGSEAILVELDSLSSIYHNGGALHFGPDGMLYIGVGDNQVGGNAQSVDNLLGKILRIRPIPGAVIPSDNPATFPGVAGSPQGNNRAIWALGLRNPFTFAFQPGTGRMFINDVGSNAFEEINDGAPGRNFGWPTTEGMFDTAQFPAFTAPFHAYEHNPEWGGGVCISGGVFYNPPVSVFPPSFTGNYFFGDYQQSGWIRRLDLESGRVYEFALLQSAGVDLDVDPQGRLIVLSHSKLRRIDYSAPAQQCRTPEIARLNAINETPGAGFGLAIGLSEDTLIIGAPFFDTTNGIDAGAAFVFTRNGQNWTQQAMLSAHDGAIGNFFGMSVAISGDRVLVGSPQNNGGNVNSAGAAYVFVRDSTVWTLETKLIAPDASVQDLFGTAVAMTSNSAMVGSIRRDSGGFSDAGATYAFTRDGTTWTYDSTLVPSDPSVNANFGTSISMENDRVLIGASKGNANKGCAYIFDRINGLWTQKARLTASDGVANDQLGCAVSLSGDSALVGARNVLPISVLMAGAAYLYELANETWIQTHRFTAPDPNAYGAFGYGVALSGSRAIIGAPYSSLDGEKFQGTAYVFTRSNSDWALEEMLVTSDATQNDCFGGAIAADDSVVFIGQEQNFLPGSVYMFVVPNVRGDLDNDGDVDLVDAPMFIDVILGLDSDPLHRSRADMNCDGSPNGQDITNLVEAIISS